MEAIELLAHDKRLESEMAAVVRETRVQFRVVTIQVGRVRDRLEYDAALRLALARALRDVQVW